MANIYFSDFIEETEFLDWNNITGVDGVNYQAHLEIAWTTPDTILWTHAPYIYTFLRNSGTDQVTLERLDGLNMKAKWDWKE